MLTIRDINTKFKAAGVYTIYNDQTIAPQINSGEIIRLVVGFSKTGPFNKPVFINRGDYNTAARIFGNLDKTLERKGSFFHRSLSICLESGPVLALNLLKLNNEEEPTVIPEGYVQPEYPADLVPYTPFSLAPTEKNGSTTDRLFSSYFNKERFWDADERYLLATRLQSHQGFLFNLVNLSKSPVTYLVRKSDILGFDVIVEEWYGSGNIPAYLNKSDFISDYFLDVIVIDGNFGADRYAQLSTDPIYGSYFDAGGLIADTVDDFLSLREVSVKRVFTGCVIPGFKDKRNTPYYIEDIINGTINQYNILCAIDQKQLDDFEYGTNTNNLDMVGHGLVGGTVADIDFLSYKARLAQDFQYEQRSNNNTITIDTTTGVTISNINPGVFTVNIDQSSPEFGDLVSNMELGDYVMGETTPEGTILGIPVLSPVLIVTRLLKTNNSITFDLTNGFKANENAVSGSLVDIKITTDAMVLEYNPSRFYRDGTNTYYVADNSSSVYGDYESGELTSGDKILLAGTEYYLKFVEMKASNGVDLMDDYRDILKIELYQDAELTTLILTGDAPDFGSTYDSKGFPVTAPNKLNMVSSVGDMNVRLDIQSVEGRNVVLLPLSEQNISHEDFLAGTDEDGNPILTRIKTIQNVDLDGDGINDAKRVVTYDNILIYTGGAGTNQIERFKSFDNYVKSYNLIYQSGFTLKQNHLPDGTNSRMRDIYAVMTDSIMRAAIVDPDMIEFRYFVDTFNHGLEPNSKSYLASMLSDRQTCMGLINSPSVQEFIDSVNPRFTTTPTAVDPLPSFESGYVNSGGNLDENPAFLYTMPDETQGASWMGYFFPNVTILDDDRRVEIPPAALVSNAFMRKYASGEPYKVVANRRGVLTSTRETLVGVEYRLTSGDRGQLEAKGLNPIIQKKDGTIMIYGNQTGFQNFRSVLNNLHVRDMLISIQIDVHNILENYVFEFNNDALRLEISSLLRNYLQTLQNSYRAINFFDVIVDRTNNRPEIIRENVGIIDLIIEPTDVATRYINRITLTKSGEPAVGGFVAI